MDAATVAAPPIKPKPRRVPADKPMTVTLTDMAAHLDLSRAFIGALQRDGVIDRLPDGRFDQDITRVRYLRHLRNPARRAARSEAEGKYRDLKARALMLKIARAEGELIEIEEHLSVSDEVCGLCSYRTLRAAREVGRPKPRGPPHG